jgi:hypothetical protein
MCQGESLLRVLRLEYNLSLVPATFSPWASGPSKTSGLLRTQLRLVSLLRFARDSVADHV